MEFENLLTLMKTMSASELREFSYEEKGMQIMMSKRNDQPNHVLTEAYNAKSESELIHTSLPDPILSEETPVVSVPETSAGNLVTSPLVGVFYAAPAEDATPYVCVGDKITRGQTLAIVEAMKLMNEIESDYSGTIAEILVQNGQAVEYGQPLFRII